MSPIELRPITREAAEGVLAGDPPAGVRVPDDYPTEFSEGVARSAGTLPFGPFFMYRSEDDLVVVELGGALIDDYGTLETVMRVNEWSLIFDGGDHR